MSRSTLQEGLNSLIDFQLRKENAALLEKANAHTKQLELLAAETNRNRKDFEERISKLETTISDLKNAEQKQRQDFTKYIEDIASFRSQVGIVVEKVDTCGQQLVEARDAKSPDDTPDSQTNDTQTIRATETPPRHQRSVTSLKIIEQDPTTPSQASEAVPQSIHSPATDTRHPTAELIATSFTNPVTRRRSRSIDISTPNQPLPQIEPQPSQPQVVASSSKSKPPSHSAPKQVKIPRLHQGTSSLSIYLNKTTSAYQSLDSPNDQKFNTDFVAAFVRGIRDADKRELLVEELQQQHPSRTKKDGKIEIMCMWEDVGKVMETAGLLAPGDVGSGPDPKSQRLRSARELKGLLDN